MLTVKPSKCRSLHGFHTLHFICCQFGLKLLLQLIQNQARDCFQAFVHCHDAVPSKVAVLSYWNLSRCCCWGSYFFVHWIMDRLKIEICCFAQDWLFLCLICTQDKWIFEPQSMLLKIPPKMCLSAAPRALSLTLQSICFFVFWNSLREWLPDDRHSGWHCKAGAQDWTQTWTLPPDQLDVKV